MLNVFELTLK